MIDVLEDGAKIPVGHNKASSYLVFDSCVTLGHKSRWVKYGHRTPESELHAFTGVLSREGILIALTHTDLNDLLFCTCDVQNSYLQAYSSLKNHFICSLEFGLKNAGNRAITLYTLHGSKSSRANYW